MFGSSEQGPGKTERYTKRREAFCIKLSCIDLIYYTGNIPEVTKVDIDMEGQRVFVESTLSSEELLATLKKTGRECSYVGVKQ